MKRSISLVAIIFIIVATNVVCNSSTQSLDDLKSKSLTGDANSQFSLGFMYYHGRGIGQDYNEAAKWFSKSASAGNAKAQYELGKMYENGQSFEQNYNSAFEWYAKSANQNYAKAQYELGKFYSLGLGTQQNNTEAFSWFEKAAVLGLNDAQFELGVMYLKGIGTKKNDTEAEKWLLKSAVQNNVKAQYYLGLLYCKDRDEEIQHNYKEAVKWFSRAGAQNHIESQYLLGVMYCRGEGVEQDYKTAAKWFIKAASQGSARAQLVLGACYWNGKGVNIDYAESLKWMSLASMNGDKDAKLLKSELIDKMTTAQIEEAQKRINKVKKVKGYLTEKDHFLKDSQKADEKTELTSTGFFISPNGYILTAYHAVERCENIQILHDKKKYTAIIAAKDEALDIAMLKIDGNDFSYLPLSLNTVQTGDQVFTMGYPQVSLQGTEPKFTEGSISSLSGSGDNLNYFQISVPVQPGNSGGPLINQKGEVIGLVVARLNDISALLTTGAVPQNVNYALKSQYILSFLNASPELSKNIPSKGISIERAAAIEIAKKSVVLITAYK
ncbi:MAG: trypsin-like peptidase domain-containing protein [Phycisphaerales bacterium]